MPDFKDRLKQCIREEPVAAFARRCGLPEATIRSYLNGKKPVYDKLVRIADAAGVSIDWLATGRGSMRPHTHPRTQPIDDIEEKILIMLNDMDEDKKRDVLKYIQEKKLLMELLEERKQRKVG
ncbi:MAG: helix-turn-helix transcriptional regulator [Deltaproteobacteria bacterium]|nr:helix-turn-helix transcriptional regulator [Deltaproteobacteria bacterium]